MSSPAARTRAGILSLLAVLIGLGVIAAAVWSGNLFAVLGGDDTTPPIVSYCGDPGFFDQFNDQYGYTPAQQCTGVQIAGYRVDVSISEYYSGSRGCYSEYTVYNMTGDGLRKVAERGPGSTADIELPGLEISPQTEATYDGIDCRYIGTRYDVTLPGNVQFDASGDTAVPRGDDATVTVATTNLFDQAVTGDLTVDICAPGPFGQDACITREADVELAPGQRTTTRFTFPTDRVYGSITVTPTLSGGVQRPTGWQGVNADCDGDGTIEPMDRCDAFDLGTATGDPIQVQVGNPERQQDSVLTTVFTTMQTTVSQLLAWLGLAG